MTMILCYHYYHAYSEWNKNKRREESERHQPVFEDDESDWSIASVSHMLIDAAAHVSIWASREGHQMDRGREKESKSCVSMKQSAG